MSVSKLRGNSDFLSTNRNSGEKLRIGQADVKRLFGFYIDGSGATVDLSDASSYQERPDRDARILQSQPDNNFGAQANFVVAANSYVLMHFPIAKPPKTASLSLYSRTTQGDGTLSIYGLKKENAVWIQGVGDNDPAIAGEPTWNNRVHDTDPWLGGDGLREDDPIFGYREDLLLGSLAHTSGTATSTNLDIELDMDNLNQWLLEEGNAGFILVGDGGNFNFFSWEGAVNPANGPYLTGNASYIAHGAYSVELSVSNVTTNYPYLDDGSLSEITSARAVPLDANDTLLVNIPSGVRLHGASYRYEF